MAQKKQLSYKQKNVYELINAKEEKQIDKVASDYMAFLNESKTEREAHDTIIRHLKANGFSDLEHLVKKNIPLSPGDKVYFSNKGKSLVASVIGKNPCQEGMRIIGGHIDAPRIDIKQNPLYESGGFALLDTFYYGGIKKYQWVTIPLALHGVVVKPNGKKIKVSIGEKADDPIFFISDILPHLGQEQAQKPISKAILGEDLDVVFGSKPSKTTEKEKVKNNILKLLKEKYDIEESDLFSSELQLVPAGPAREAGIDKSMIVAYAQDDRACAYSALKALLNVKKIPEYTSHLIFSDKEEIGSYGSSGMLSNFFEIAVAEIMNLQNEKHNSLALKRALRNSKMISADVNSMYDPLYPNVFEKKNSSFINNGISIVKYGGGRGKFGSSDANAEFVAEIINIFKKNKVAYQMADLGKVDVGGAGTIAYMLAQHGMEVIDCGMAVLAMHAPWELLSKADLYMTLKGYTAFLNSK
jgi:aspartyl aminopeptidase